MADPLRAHAATGSGSSVAVALVVALGVLLAACTQEARPSGAVPASASPALSTDSVPDGSPSLPIAAPPTIDPAQAEGVTLTCGEAQTFPASALVGQGRAESEPEAASLALRELVSSPDGRSLGLPILGWHRVSADESKALFVAPATTLGSGPWLMVGLMRDSTGAWTMDIAGDCHLTVALPDGIGAASWWLDPKAGRPPLDATIVRAFVLEQACASGRSPEGRVLPPAVLRGAVAIWVMFAVRTMSGDQDCPGNPPLAIQLDLGEPVGVRQLLDGGTFPARDASVVPN
jgi:hypothetical protein